MNRSQKGARDAAEWRPTRHGAWFAQRGIQINLEYGSSIRLSGTHSKPWLLVEKRNCTALSDASEPRHTCERARSACSQVERPRPRAKPPESAGGCVCPWPHVCRPASYATETALTAASRRRHARLPAWCPDADLTGANLVGTKLLHANFPDAILSRTLHWRRYRRRVNPLLADMDGHTLKVQIAASMTPSSSELVDDVVPQGRNFAF